MKATFLTSLGLLLSANIFAATITWTNSNGGDWGDPANWSPNQVPGAGDVADITDGGTYTVTAAEDILADEVNLGAANGAQTLTLTANSELTASVVVESGGVLNVDGDSDVRGAVTVEAGGELNFTGSGNKTVYDMVLTNHGTVNHVAGSLLGDSETMITNTGLWDIQGATDPVSFQRGDAPELQQHGDDPAQRGRRDRAVPESGADQHGHDRGGNGDVEAT